MYKKLLICVIIIILLCISGRHYSYTEHTVYIYKFLDDNRIKFIDKYNSFYIIQVDSEKYNKYVKPEYRKNYYKIRTYDNGIKYILSDTYGKY